MRGTDKTRHFSGGAASSGKVVGVSSLLEPCHKNSSWIWSSRHSHVVPSKTQMQLVVLIFGCQTFCEDSPADAEGASGVSKRCAPD